MAENTCSRTECKITITINIAFAGATNQQMNKWVNEIKDVWNQPNQTTGKCECEVAVEVNATNPPNCQHDDAKNRHCVTVTAALPVDSNGVQRIALQVISQNGQSTNGKWSTSTSREISGPVTVGGETYNPQQGETFKDAAHEAGHMLGLGEDYDEATGQYGNSIMGRTWGPDAKPNQAQIDQIVENNCTGEDKKCPAKCCCGNGKVDEDIDPKEECDPKAEPTGCEEGAKCTDECKCVKEEEKKPVCGDGKVEEPEECDPKAEPTGCSADEECVGCVCKEKPETEPPPETPIPETEEEQEEIEEEPAEEQEPAEEPATEPVSEPVCGNFLCETGENCSNCDDCICYMEQICAPGEPGADFRGCVTEQEEEETPPEEPTPEEPYCGDGTCDSTENCSVCEDCVCSVEEICDPSSPDADYRGCAPEPPPAGPVCGDGICDVTDENCASCPIDCVCPPEAVCGPGDPEADPIGCILY
ncbi:hypothetical protein GF366_01195 [Candidatus Peregrinibacteria bacterium]|nr:hypothetical protein [Candidatus Peregrinibacteria bacterium]